VERELTPYERLRLLQFTVAGARAPDLARALRIAGALDVEALSSSLSALVASQAAFRTTCVTRDGETRAVVRERSAIELRVERVAEAEPPERLAALARTPVAPLGEDGTPACLQGEILVRSRHVALGYWRQPSASFHDLGGHSLLLTGVQREVEPALGLRIPLHRFFQYPTIARLAGFIRGELGGGRALARVEERAERRRLVRARRAGR
jgi:hypothetical protein